MNIMNTLILFFDVLRSKKLNDKDIPKKIQPQDSYCVLLDGLQTKAILRNEWLPDI